MKNLWHHIVYKNAYLLLGAAWLFTLSFVFSNYWSYTSSPKGVQRSLEKYIAKQETEIKELVKQDSLLLQLNNASADPNTIQDLFEKPYGIFLYELEKNGPINLHFWNTQTILPTTEILARKDGQYFDSLANGEYETIRRKINSRDKKLLLIALIPIRQAYFLQNEYLINDFVKPPKASKNYEISNARTPFPIRNTYQQTLFYLQPINGIIFESNDWVTILLRLAGLIFILMFIHQAAVYINDRYGLKTGMIMMISGILVIKFFINVLDLPIDLHQFQLFSPDLFSSMGVHSLGSLLVDISLLLWLLIFFHRQAIHKTISFPSLTSMQQWSLVLLLMSTVLAISFYSANLIRILVAYSQIPFDVTNFFGLNSHSAFGLIALCALSIFFLIATQWILRLSDAVKPISVFIRLIIIATIGLIYLTVTQPAAFRFQIMLLIWTLFYVLLSHWGGMNSLSFTGTKRMYWLLLFSGSLTLVIDTENIRQEELFRKRIAEKIAWQADPSSEKLLKVVIENLQNSFWLTHLDQLNDPVRSAQIKDSIINANFSGYLNRYETDLMVYDPNGRPFTGIERYAYDTLSTIYTMQGKRTGVKDLRYFETAFDQFSYIHRREVVDTAAEVKAIVYMIAHPRRYKSEAMVPELFRQNEDYIFERSPLYAFAVYNQGELVMHVNDYPFPISLAEQELNFPDYVFKNKDGYSELWYRQGGERVVIVSRKTDSLLEWITLFAYLFCIFLFLVGIIQFLQWLPQFRFTRMSATKIWQLNIRQQIFSTIIFLMLFSFVIVGLVTVFFFINRYNLNNQERLSRTIQVMANDLSSRTDIRNINLPEFRHADSANSDRLVSAVERLAELHHVDMNIYNKFGELMVSSQPLVYSKGILSSMMEPKAYYQMRILGNIQHVQQEWAGKLKYLSVYIPIKDENRHVQGFVNIPYFTSRRDLNQEISNFLVTLINLNAFIFLVAGIISVFLTNRITASLGWIGEKMRRVNLSTRNEEINWDRSDEIGELVSEYNKMVRKLEQSAVDLARSEREGAWREMARQVAHEIKNPLTPMKLSIQHLQRAMENDVPNVREMTSVVSKTLIEQIEHLSKIASEFSQFANIGNVQLEKIDLHDQIRSLVLLHSTSDAITINWTPVPQQIFLKADKTHINRLFTNLLQNAIESIPERRTGKIDIKESLQEDFILLSIQDNGTGIHPTIEKNIFVPNFTTKTSGTGLGLAMCKGIVEQMQGTIWFETIPDQGTSFYVRLPLDH